MCSHNISWYDNSFGNESNKLLSLYNVYGANDAWIALPVAFASFSDKSVVDCIMELQ